MQFPTNMSDEAFDRGMAKIDEILALHPELKERYMSGDEELTNRLISFALDDNNAASEFKVSNTGTMWDNLDLLNEITEATQGIILPRVTAPKEEEVELFDEDDSDTDEIEDPEVTAGITYALEQLIRSEFEYPCCLESTRELPFLYNYLKSYAVSLDAEIYSDNIELNSLQRIINFDNMGLISCQEHLYLTNWGAAYDKIGVSSGLSSLDEGIFEPPVSTAPEGFILGEEVVEDYDATAELSGGDLLSLLRSAVPITDDPWDDVDTEELFDADEEAEEPESDEESIFTEDDFEFDDEFDEEDEPADEEAEETLNDTDDDDEFDDEAILREERESESGNGVLFDEDDEESVDTVDQTDDLLFDFDESDSFDEDELSETDMFDSDDEFEGEESEDEAMFGEESEDDSLFEEDEFEDDSLFEEDNEEFDGDASSLFDNDDEDDEKQWDTEEESASMFDTDDEEFSDDESEEEESDDMFEADEEEFDDDEVDTESDDNMFETDDDEFDEETSEEDEESAGMFDTDDEFDDEESEEQEDTFDTSMFDTDDESEFNELDELLGRGDDEEPDDSKMFDTEFDDLYDALEDSLEGIEDTASGSDLGGNPLGASDFGVPTVSANRRVPRDKNEAAAETILSLYNKLVKVPSLVKKVFGNMFSNEGDTI